MNRKIALAAALAALTASGAMAPAALAKAPAPHRDCFWTRDVNNFAAADEHTVNVKVGVRDVYQMEMFGSCPDVDWNQRIALVSRGTSMICSGLDAEIITHSPIGPQRCPVRNIHKLTAAEIAALPKRARP
jgi:hypothetical protein